MPVLIGRRRNGVKTTVPFTLRFVNERTGHRFLVQRADTVAPFGTPGG